jgi:hypothetical protein
MKLFEEKCKMLVNDCLTPSLIIRIKSFVFIKLLVGGNRKINRFLNIVNYLCNFNSFS